MFGSKSNSGATEESGNVWIRRPNEIEENESDEMEPSSAKLPRNDGRSGVSSGRWWRRELPGECDPEGWWIDDGIESKM